MEGVALDEAFGGTSILPAAGSFSHTEYDVLGFFRRPVSKDLSGANLDKLIDSFRNQSLQGQTVSLDTTELQLKTFVEEFKGLRETQKKLLDEIQQVETYIKELEKAEQQNQKSSEDFTKQILKTGVFSQLEFNTLQDALRETSKLQQTYAKKALNSYTEKGIELQCKLDTTNSHLSIYREFLQNGTKEMLGENATPGNCTICYERKPTHCLVPCGHIFCDECIRKTDNEINYNLTTYNCMTCRQRVEKKIKVYLP